MNLTVLFYPAIFYLQLWKQLQCNPDIRELSGPEKKYLISGFGLFCYGKYGNTSYNAFYVQNAGLFNSYRH